MNLNEIKLPDNGKIKQFAIGNGADGRPFFAFLSESGRLYVESHDGWPYLAPLHEVEQRSE